MKTTFLALWKILQMFFKTDKVWVLPQLSPLHRNHKSILPSEVGGSVLLHLSAARPTLQLQVPTPAFHELICSKNSSSCAVLLCDTCQLEKLNLTHDKSSEWLLALSSKELQARHEKNLALSHPRTTVVVFMDLKWKQQRKETSKYQRAF